MMRLVSALAVAFLVAATFVLPSPRQPLPGQASAVSPVGYAVCLVDEGVGRSTEIAVTSVDPGAVRMTLFTSGRSAGTMGVEVGPEGSTVIPVVDIAAVGTVGALVELPSANAAAASVIRGAESMAAETCVSEAPAETYLTGGRTVSPQRFEVHLVNPFASDAVVALTVTSEIGTESNERFNSVVVRGMSNVVLDMTQLTPGRERLSVRVQSDVGRVVAVGRQTGPEVGAIWNAVVPATDWFVPIGDEEGSVVIGNPHATGVEYQVDVYGSLGLEPARLAGTVGAGGEVVLDFSELEDVEVHAVRVIAASPIVTGFRRMSDPAWATTAAREPALTWLVPIATHFSEPTDPDQPDRTELGTLLIFNPGLDDAEVSIVGLGANGGSTVIQLAAEDLGIFSTTPADGYLIRSDLPIVVVWLGGAEGRGAALIGVALSGG